ncbi:hypothetical protein [Streptomyces fagopyri]|uniref:hypothetical protein n=1 Tax=Streptomyces fagopyri TaxID=2662397 RepID=UPI003711EED5
MAFLLHYGAAFRVLHRSRRLRPGRRPFGRATHLAPLDRGDGRPVRDPSERPSVTAFPTSRAGGARTLWSAYGCRGCERTDRPRRVAPPRGRRPESDESDGTFIPYPVIGHAP